MGGISYGTPSHDRLYQIWYNMKRRCVDPRSSNWKDYGARGITVCAEWLTFEPFKLWSNANGYSSKLELDRRDNSKGYLSDNCAWRTHHENMGNTRWNRNLTAFGETKPLSHWVRDARCIPGRPTLESRLSAGMSAEEAITKPIRKTIQQQIQEGISR